MVLFGKNTTIACALKMFLEFLGVDEKRKNQYYTVRREEEEINRDIYTERVVVMDRQQKYNYDVIREVSALLFILLTHPLQHPPPATLTQFTHHSLLVLHDILS